MGDQDKKELNEEAVVESAEEQITSDEQQQSQDTEQSEPQSIESLTVQLVAAQAETDKFKDAYLRAKAEEDNVRRRSEKEVSNSRKFALEGFAKELLGVYDSLAMACSVDIGEQADDSVKQIHEGVEVTLKQLQSALNRNGVREVKPEVGDKLDPNVHQAVSQIDSPDVESGCIVSVMQSGFTLNERLIRPAMVIVVK